MMNHAFSVCVCVCVLVCVHVCLFLFFCSWRVLFWLAWGGGSRAGSGVVLVVLVVGMSVRSGML